MIPVFILDDSFYRAHRGDGNRVLFRDNDGLIIDAKIQGSPCRQKVRTSCSSVSSK